MSCVVGLYLVFGLGRFSSSWDTSMEVKLVDCDSISLELPVQKSVSTVP